MAAANPPPTIQPSGAGGHCYTRQPMPPFAGATVRDVLPLGQIVQESRVGAACGVRSVAGPWAA